MYWRQYILIIGLIVETPLALFVIICFEIDCLKDTKVYKDINKFVGKLSKAIKELMEDYETYREFCRN